MTSRAVAPAATDAQVLRAWDALQQALADADARTPCAGDDRWVSDDLDELVEAADGCLDCPAMVVCHAYAELAGEEWGCWGGVVRDRRFRVEGAA